MFSGCLDIRKNSLIFRKWVRALRGAIPIERRTAQAFVLGHRPVLVFRDLSRVVSNSWLPLLLYWIIGVPYSVIGYMRVL